MTETAVLLFADTAAGIPKAIEEFELAAAALRPRFPENSICHRLSRIRPPNDP